ncbi:MAG: leucine-rich repeat domain-containing protein [Clostridia bacterium]|nr:leucine-rich repeat domain-containing protein [Clostridia bacterium]
MKKVSFSALVLVLALCLLTLAACDGLNGEETTEEHICSFGEWAIIKEATCTKMGEQERTCACGEKETQNIDALGHNYKSAVTEPTATKNGLAVYTCSECGDSYNEVIKPIDFTVNSRNRTKIGYTGEMGEQLIIPDVFCDNDGIWYRVTGIYDRAFEDCSNLTSITIPDGVTSIDDRAFEECSALTSVIFGENSQLTSIGDYAFEECSALTSVNFGENSQLTSIGGSAFEECSALTSVIFGENSQLTSIGSCAFNGCSGLTSITIPDSVTSIGPDAFNGCIDVIQIENGISYVGKWIIDCDNDATQAVIREDTVGIGGHAFWGCDLLTSITIPNGVISIGNAVFVDCKNLTSVVFEENSQLTSIGCFAFDGCSSLKSITIPDGVTIIDLQVFKDCSSLTSITIPDSVTHIGKEAFYNCYSLTSITIPDSVEVINDYAFDGCSSLTSIAFGENSQLTNIFNYAFSGCSSLTSIIIPDSIMGIGHYVFNDCSSLTTVYYMGSEEEWAEIIIGWDNPYLTNATIVYNYVPEE